MSSTEMHEYSLDESEQLVVFELANELYGVDIGAVNTIIRMQEVTRIPRTPDYVEGVINLRGSIIPVVDLRTRFGLGAGERTKASRIVVVEALGLMIGMVVDAVAETLRLPSDAIEPPSPVVTSVGTEYIRGVGKQENRLVILLDIDRVLTSEEMASLAKVSKRAQKAQESADKAA
jgi:purine-binding chemotaxis protein CheW